MSFKKTKENSDNHSSKSTGLLAGVAIGLGASALGALIYKFVKSDDSEVENKPISYSNDRNCSAYDGPGPKEMCTICLEEMSKPDVTLKCKHKFHYSCLAKFNIDHDGKECPNCRGSI